MIRVEVQPYCDACCDFDPDVKKPEKMFFNNGASCQSDTIIRCKNAKRCEAIKRYLESQAKKEAAE